MALSRQNRLVKKRDLDRVYKEGNTAKGSFLFIRYLKNGLKESRFAFIISLKTAGNAVARNRIKRVFAEIVRGNIENIGKGYDVAITLRKKVEEDSLKKELARLLKII